MGIMYARIQLRCQNVKSKYSIITDVFSRKYNVTVHTSADIIRKLLVLTKFSVTEEIQEKL